MTELPYAASVSVVVAGGALPVKVSLTLAAPAVCGLKGGRERNALARQDVYWQRLSFYAETERLELPSGNVRARPGRSSGKRAF